jgi:isoleucyl-tRNA synthetase
MAENTNPKPQTEVHAGDALQKTPAALREEAVMAFWDEHNVFEQTLKKEAPQGNFVFYDGPPYATGLPHFGHIIPSTIKDIIPRYKTMKGYHVPRKWGWDCHGLPIENLIEKELNLKDKKAIEEYGIAKFNKAAKDSVFRYDVDWKRQVKRAGRWVDMDNDYHTMDSSYTESVWWSFKTLNEKGLVYRAHKVMPFCPRCQTSLSNFEVGQGYKDIPDISAYVLFELTDTPNTSFLAWTTTPWTLPGNSALAVSPELEYSLIKIGDSKIWLASALIPKLKEKQILKDEFEVVKTSKGSELVGISYKPVFDFYTQVGTLDTDEEKKRSNAWKVYAADFVTAEDGSGIVHIAPAFGDDDYKLSTEYNIPVIQHVLVNGHIKEGNGTLSGLVAKPKNDHQLTDIEVIKLLAHSHTTGGTPLLFAKEKIVHSYPHCWRCETPLLNYATSSWFVKATELKDKLVSENEKVNWIPQEVGRGRFGKWLENVRDWAVSRSRYWGSPIPVWRDEVTGESEFIGSVNELKAKIPSRGNSITIMRHGESESNVKDVISSNPKELELYALTEKGRSEVEASAQELKTKLGDKKLVKIYSSDFRRTRETAEHIADALGIDHSQIIFDARLREVNCGIFDGQSWSKRLAYFKNLHEKIFNRCPEGESVQDVKRRVSEFLYELDSKHENEHVLVVTHGLPLRMMLATSEGVTCRDLLRSGWRDISDPTASLHEIKFKALPHNEE